MTNSSSGGKAQRQGSQFEKTFGVYLDGNPRYAFEPQHRIDCGKADGRPCKIDALVYDRISSERIAVSCKAQTSTGSVEEKMVYELLHLSHLVHSSACDRSYLVLLGNGFSKFKQFLVSPYFKEYMPCLAWGNDWSGVQIVGFDDIVTLISKETL